MLDKAAATPMELIAATQVYGLSWEHSHLYHVFFILEHLKSWPQEHLSFLGSNNMKFIFAHLLCWYNDLNNTLPQEEEGR